MSRSGFCSVVDAGCKAAPGYRTFSGMHFGDTKVCTECHMCGLFVCTECSQVRDGKRMCNNCFQGNINIKPRKNYP